MEGKNNSNVVVILLVVIILGLVGFIVYDKVLNKTDLENNNISNNQEQIAEQKVVYSYNAIKGLYTYESNMKTQNNFNYEYELYLYENGTFIYYEFEGLKSRAIGNYTIVDNKIILNELFRTGTDVGIKVNKEEILTTLIINSDNTITDENHDIGSIVLNKEDLLKEKEFLEQNENNITYIFNNDYFANDIIDKMLNGSCS